jgi:hypothetical protein
MSESKVVSGTVMSVESVITTFRNKDAYNALSEKVNLILTLDNNRDYQIDSPPEGVKIGAKVNLYCYKEGKAVLINKTSSKYIKRERFWNVLLNYSICIGSGISSFLLLIELITFSKRDGFDYNIFFVFIFSLILAAFCFVFIRKDADKVVHPEDLKKIDILLEKNIEEESFISPEEIDKVKSTHKEKINV